MDADIRANGLPTWDLFRDRLEHCLARARRSKTAFGVALIAARCLDQTGAAVDEPEGWWQVLADRLQTLVRSSDTVAMAPDRRFALLLEDVSDSRGAAIGLDRTLSEITEFGHEGHVWQVELRAGVAVSRPPHRPAEEILLKVEVALLHAMERPGTGFFLNQDPPEPALKTERVNDHRRPGSTAS
jgi:GGDEF domain-containing protein